MSKRGPGRPCGWAVDGAVLRRRMDQLVLTPQALAAMSRKSGESISESVIRDALDNKRLSKTTIRTLGALLELRPEEFITDPAFPRDEVEDSPGKQAPESARRKPTYRGTAVIEPDRPLADRQDVKNVITNTAISRAILSGENIPSLHRVIVSTAFYTPMNDAHKDRPFADGFAFNHFFQPAIALLVTWRNRGTPLVVAYDRRPSATRVSHVHTRGLALLWATSYVYGLKVTSDWDMHEWVDGVEAGTTSADDFHEGKNPLLVRLIDRKLGLRDHNLSFEPLGVITNDQRVTGSKDKTSRVYTQYVFKGVIHLEREPANMASFLRGLVRQPVDPYALELADSPHERFQDPNKRKKNHMDIVAWLGLVGTEERISDGTATFLRNFNLVT